VQPAAAVTVCTCRCAAPGPLLFHLLLLLSYSSCLMAISLCLESAGASFLPGQGTK
jgi:hypothetical protein